MSTLLQGQTASLVLAVGDSYTISSAGTATVRGIYGAPSTTTTITASFGTFGPYSAPAKLDVVAVSGPAEYAIVAPTQAQVSGGNGITDAQAIIGSVTGLDGEVRTLSDGTNARARVRWEIPDGAVAYAWCWDIFPLAKYEG